MAGRTATTGQHVDNRVEPQRPDLVAKALVPDYALGAHVAPLGLTLCGRYRAARPAQRHVHRRTRLLESQAARGYKVVFVPFTNGKPSGPADRRAHRFRQRQGRSARAARSGVAMDQTGALLVADDVGNTIWRVTQSAQTSTR